MQPQYASAGNAKEKSTALNPVGLYRNPDGLFVGCLEEAGADAVVRQGFVLVEEGREAAMTTEEDLAKYDKPKSDKESK